MPDPEIARRNARNRAAGKRWERDLMTGLREHAIDIERSRDTGEKDEGDHVVRLADGTIVIVQAKNEASYDLSRYVRDVKEQRRNYLKRRPHVDPSKVRAVAIVKARGKGTTGAYVVTDVADYFSLEETT